MSDLTDKRLIILAEEDTVVVARCAIAKGEKLLVGGKNIVLETAISMGHKLALKPIPKGGKILKYGASIGSATTDIAVGDHVHLHNLQSDYTPTYAIEEPAA